MLSQLLPLLIMIIMALLHAPHSHYSYRPSLALRHERIVETVPRIENYLWVVKQGTENCPETTVLSRVLRCQYRVSIYDDDTGSTHACFSEISTQYDGKIWTEPSFHPTGSKCFRGYKWVVNINGVSPFGHQAGNRVAGDAAADVVSADFVGEGRSPRMFCLRVGGHKRPVRFGKKTRDELR